MTCLATLTLAALGPWTYAGFLDDPAAPTPPPAPAAPASPTVFPDPAAGPGRNLDPDSAPTPEPPPVRSAPPARPVPPAAPPVNPPPAAPAREAASVLYRMPDATGQVWEHADPSWLQSFVMDRNRQYVRACANASCR